jgi:hypothetical protein
MKKLIEYAEIAITAIVKFTAFPFAAQITIGAFGVAVLLEGFPFWATVIVIWACVLAVREYQLRSK